MLFRSSFFLSLWIPLSFSLCYSLFNFLFLPDSSTLKIRVLSISHPSLTFIFPCYFGHLTTSAIPHTLLLRILTSSILLMCLLFFLFSRLFFSNSLISSPLTFLFSPFPHFSSLPFFRYSSLFSFHFSLYILRSDPSSWTDWLL